MGKGRRKCEKVAEKYRSVTRTNSLNLENVLEDRRKIVCFDAATVSYVF